MALPSEIADPLPASKAASPLVLLVDDSREQLEPYREHLLAAGFRVATATSGSDGVALSASRA
jgi:CheY-like chemotaxis protein